MRPFPWKCEECAERAVYLETQDLYTQPMDHDGRTYEVSVTNLQVAKCRACGFVALEHAALRRLSDALRSAAGLLQPAEIRAKRELLGLTQKQLAGYLQIAEATLSRWETGAQIQQRSLDRFMRIIFGVEAARQFIGMPAQAAPAAFVQRVTSTISWDPNPFVRQNMGFRSIGHDEAGRVVWTESQPRMPFRPIVPDTAYGSESPQGQIHEGRTGRDTGPELLPESREPLGAGRTSLRLAS